MHCFCLPLSQDSSFTLDDLDFTLGLQTTGNKKLATASLPGASSSSTEGTAPARPSATTAAQHTFGTLALEDATAKDKLWMKVDQAVAACQGQLLPAKKVMAALGSQKGTKSKAVSSAEAMLQETVAATDKVLVQLSNLSIFKAFTEGDQEPDIASLTAFLKQSQEALGSLTEALTVAKALTKGKK